MWGTIKTIFWLGITGLLIYSGFLFAMPQYRFYSFESSVKDAAKYQSTIATEVYKDLMAQAKDLGIPLNDKTLTVEGMPGRLKISARWSDEVNIFGYYKKTYDFSVQAQSQFAEKGN